MVTAKRFRCASGVILGIVEDFRDISDRIKYATRLNESHERLSDREYQVVLALTPGATMGGFANELSLSVKTISTNRARLLRKTGLSTKALLTHYAVKHDLAA
jgi:DNA-binding NarL/FixJ family response regulator